MTIRIASPVGAWRTTQYIYNPDGSFAGTIRQRRELFQLPNGNTRIIHYDTPQPELDGHPMSQFSGKRKVDVVNDGRARRYLGPDLIGSGLAWDEGVTAGQGLLPTYGHNFTSLAMQVDIERQLTWGRYYNATEAVATIIGIAVPERYKGDPDWPALDGPHWPHQVAIDWEGYRRTINPDGSQITQVPLKRHYDGQNWEDGLPDGKFALQLAEHGSRWMVSGAISGIAKQSGWLLEIEAHSEFGTCIKMAEVLDAEHKNIVGIRRWYIDDILQTVEVVKLSAVSD